MLIYSRACENVTNFELFKMQSHVERIDPGTFPTRHHTAGAITNIYVLVNKPPKTHTERDRERERRVIQQQQLPTSVASWQHRRKPKSVPKPIDWISTRFLSTTT
jgi:hypothetical protein